MRFIRSLDFWINGVLSKDQVFYIPQFIAVFFMFDKGSLFLWVFVVCWVLIWNMDCLSSKDRVLHILHAWSIFYVFDMVFESCLKMLPVIWIDCHWRIECVTYPVCVAVFRPTWVCPMCVCVCVCVWGVEEFTNERSTRYTGHMYSVLLFFTRMLLNDTC